MNTNIETSIGLWQFPFRSTWDTRIISEGSSRDNQVTLPITSANFSQLEIHWGDNTISTIDSPDSNELTHTYNTPGIYDIIIKCDSLGFSFSGIGDRNKILSVFDWGGLSLMMGGFHGCENLVLVETFGSPKSHSNMRNVFNNCKNIRFISNLELWDVSGVTNMTKLFSGSKLNQDFSMWNFNINVILEDILMNHTEQDYNAEYYDNLLIKLSNTMVNTGRSQENKRLGMGGIKYTERSEEARNILIEDGWDIQDGGIIL